MNTKTSKYKIEEGTHSFTISAPDRNTVTVILRPTYFSFESETNSWYREATYGLSEFELLKREIAGRLMSSWRPSDHAPRWHSNGRGKWRNVYDWAKGQTYIALSSRINDQLHRLRALADPEVLAVHKTAYSALQRAPDLIKRRDLYDERWLVHDLKKYRAANIVGAYPGAFAYRHYERNGTVRAVSVLKPDVGGVLEEMANWLGRLSPDGKPYRSLNRTLMNLPGGIPPPHILLLAKIWLPRPLTKRLELMAALYSVRCAGGDLTEDKERIFYHATEDQIKRAISRISTRLHLPLNHRKARDVRMAIGFMTRYPDMHRGNIVGLADKAIIWRRDEQEQKRQAILERYGTDAQTALPPIPLPVQPGVRFLQTVGDVAIEGMDMYHCVAGHAQEALDGRCYFFHVDQAGEKATVAVANDGSVIQSFGPMNQKNQAASYGRRILGKWGKQISDAPDPNPVIRPHQIA